MDSVAKSLLRAEIEAQLYKILADIEFLKEIIEKLISK